VILLIYGGLIIIGLLGAITLKLFLGQRWRMLAFVLYFLATHEQPPSNGDCAPRIACGRDLRC